MSDLPIDPTRRRLCQAMGAATGLVVLRALPGCGSSDNIEAACASGAIGVGDKASLAVGQARYVESQAIFICRDDGGYYAVDAACTHIGTDIDFVSQTAGFRCPLHGATYDFNGHVLTGPAVRDLNHYSVCSTESGILIVDLGQRVTSDTRLVA